MKRLLKFFLWSLVFGVLLLVGDQLLLRVPVQQPALAAVRTFYLDFRGRLFGRGEQAPISIDRVIGQAVTKPSVVEVPADAPARPRPKTSRPRYLYVDSAGQLQFADRLEDVPERYRPTAKALAD